jgi:hypothetical protein
MRVLLLIVLAGLFAAAPRSADACSCMARSLCQQVAAADAVFVGDVLDVVEPASGPKLVRVRVVRPYKGPREAHETVTVEMPRGSSASCSLDVVVGARVAVFATLREGALTTNLCAGSHRLAPEAAPLELPAPCPRPKAAAGRPGMGCQA